MCTKSYKASRDFPELASTGQKPNANLETKKGERVMRRFPTGFVQRNTKGLKSIEDNKRLKIIEVIQKCIILDLRNRMG